MCVGSTCRRSSEKEEDGPSDPSRERTWPPREEEMSCTTAPRDASLTKMVASMTGSISTDGEVSDAVRRLCETAVRVAIETDVCVVSGKMWAAASSVMCNAVLATGKLLKGPRASAALAPAWMEERRVGRERCAGMSEE